MPEVVIIKRIKFKCQGHDGEIVGYVVLNNTGHCLGQGSTAISALQEAEARGWVPFCTDEHPVQPVVHQPE